MANESTKIAKKESPKGEPLVVQKLALAKTNLVARLPRGIDPERFYLGILTAIQKSKASAKEGKSLLDCDPNSVLLAAYDAAEVGCNLSPSLQLGWLIPYDKECVFQPSYRFYIQKAYETGEVSSFYAEVVYASDKLDRQYAPKRNLFHAPGKDEKDRDLAHAIGSYALIEFKDGVIDWEYLTADQIDKHRSKSKQPNSMKWVDFWWEGWRITPIRVLAKRLPLRGKEWEHLVEMMNQDTERDSITINAEEILEPAVPREKVVEMKQPTETKAAETKAVEAKAEPQEQPKEQAKEQPKEAQAAGGSMFPDNDSDPFLTGAEISTFWEKAFASNWKKSEVTAFLQKEFNVTAPKDLHRSQANAALNLISQAKE